MSFQPTVAALARKPLYVFLLFWILTFLIYLPAAHSGFVADMTSTFDSLIHDPFLDFLNRRRSGVKSMYQLIQLVNWAIYQVAGFNRWAWHLVFVTAQSVTCLLLFNCCKSVFTLSGIEKPWLPALVGCLLFATSPYIAEVVVWESAFQYMMDLIFLLGILIFVQRFQSATSIKPAIAAGLLFFAATFSHELWYLTPVFTIALALYYRLALNGTARIFTRTLVYFTLPQLACFGLHVWLFRLIYGHGVPRVGNSILAMPPGYYLVKPPWYFFHLFAWGRFFPDNLRQAVYNVFRTPAGALCFYGILGAICLYVLFRFHRMHAFGKLLSFFFACYLIAQSILVVLYFPENGLVVYDRYTYYLLAFQWMMVALLLTRIDRKIVRLGSFALLLGVNLYFAIGLSLKWGESEAITNALLRSPVLKRGKVKLLLNSPSNLCGISMIGLSPNGEFRLMHNLFVKPAMNDTLLEVAAYGMQEITDGAQVQMLNDSMIKVSLNQPGKWSVAGAYHPEVYRHAYFRIDTVDRTHFFIMTLSKPYDQYQLLYQQGKLLKEVNMQQRGAAQN